MIEIRNVMKRYELKNGYCEVLKGIDLNIPKGSVFGIIGESGAGKSTLLRCINGLLRPDNGEVLVNGKKVGSLDRKELIDLRKNIGMIFQSFNLLMQSSVYSNIAFPLQLSNVDKKMIGERVEELAKIVGLSEKLQSYPRQLSGGQRQRVAIARALATKPEILLCDEATSALDPITTKSVLELLKSINDKMGITIVLITHEMLVIKEICTHVAVIEDGLIKECARTEEVFGSPKSLAAKKLVLPYRSFDFCKSKRCYRVVFDDENINKPVLSEAVINSNVRMNILFADIQRLNQKAYGQMILEFVGEKEKVQMALDYLKERKVRCEEVSLDVGSPDR